MPDPKNVLEEFADLCAQLESPLIPRAVALENAGLDEMGLARARARWTVELAGDPALRNSFRVAYASARSKTARPKGREIAGAAGVALLASGSAPPLVDAGEVRRGPVITVRDELDLTGEVMPRVLPETPFVDVERDAQGTPMVAAGVPRGAVDREDTGTVELSPGSVPRAPATPFETPSAVAPPTDNEIDLDTTTEFQPRTKEKT